MLNRCSQTSRRDVTCILVGERGEHRRLLMIWTVVRASDEPHLECGKRLNGLTDLGPLNGARFTALLLKSFFAARWGLARVKEKVKASRMPGNVRKSDQQGNVWDTKALRAMRRWTRGSWWAACAWLFSPLIAPTRSELQGSHYMHIFLISLPEQPDSGFHDAETPWGAKAVLRVLASWGVLMPWLELFGLV